MPENIQFGSLLSTKNHDTRTIRKRALSFTTQWYNVVVLDSSGHWIRIRKYVLIVMRISFVQLSIIVERFIRPVSETACYCG